jgi:hypothetical protein
MKGGSASLKSFGPPTFSASKRTRRTRQKVSPLHESRRRAKYTISDVRKDIPADPADGRNLKNRERRGT